MAQEKRLRQSYEGLQSAVVGLQNLVNNLRQAVSSNAEVLSAIVSLLGEGSVQGEMERLRQEAQDRQESQMAAGVRALIDARVLKPVAEVALNNLIVGTDVNPDGKTRRVQFELKENLVPADVLPKLIGQKPGFSIVNNGVKLTIVEAYEIDKVRAAEYQVEQAKASQEAAAKAAATAQQPVSVPEGVTPNVPDAPLPADEATQKAIDESGDAAPATDAPQA